MKPLLVGWMPSAERGEYALGGKIADRLLRWAGLLRSSQGLRYYFDTHNLNYSYHVTFNHGEARMMAGYIEEESRATVLCGRDVARFFGLGGLSFWRWVGNHVVIPHPSGRNRLYNDRQAQQRTGHVLRAALRKCQPPDFKRSHARSAKIAL